MSSTLVGWLITIAFIVILVVGFFIGFWRGLKRSTVNLIGSVIGVIVAFFITPSITKVILGIQVIADGQSITLQALIVEMLKSDKDIKAMMLANKNLEAFFLNLPNALFNVIVFIFVTISIEIFIYIVYKILAVTVFKIKEDEKKHAVFGGIVGLGKTLIVMLLAFMPLAGLSGMASTLMVTENYGITTTAKNNSILEDKLPEGSADVISGIENNMLTKMCGVFGLDNAMFDYYSGFELDNEKLYIRKEVNNIYKIVDFSYQVSKADLKELNYVTVRYDKVFNAVEKTTNSTLFKKVLAETLADLIVNYKSYSFLADSQFAEDYAEILDNMGAHLQIFIDNGKTYKYFQNDLLEVISAVKAVGQSGMINEVLALEDASIEDVAGIITSEDYENALKNAITNVLNANIVRDSIVMIADKGLYQITTELDKIGVTTESWTEDAWDNFSSSVVNIVNDFGDIVSEVDLFKVLEDATVLLDKDENYDINFITSKMGALLDEVRANPLLKNEEGKPIIDNLLKNNNIILPENEVKDHNGDYTILLDSYTDYFNFIKPSLIKLRDKGVYEVINNNSLSSSQMLEKLAEIISVEGNENLLKDIILPLYQVEPTKSIIINELTNSLQSDLVSFSKLESYEDWESDLGYLSSMLITLNGMTDGTNSYLSMALNGNLDGIVDNLTEINVENVLKPILYAKSTIGIKNELFASIKSQLDNASGANSTISLEGVTLVEGAEEDQVNEICEIVKKLIAVDKALNDGGTLKTVDKTILGTLLNTMKANAYRVELLLKTEQGVFKNAFVDLVNKFKSEYQTEVEYIETQPDILAELGVDSLAEENYSKINFVQLLNKIAEAESLN